VSGLSVSRDAIRHLSTEIAVHGARPAETGGFLLAHANTRERLDVLALADQVGINRGRDLFRIRSSAIERLFTWAGDQDLLIRAQVHSHRGGAFLSETDLRHGFAVEGFITSVVPNYARPPDDPASWGWWSYSARRWRVLCPPSVAPGRARVVRFDQAGVDER
jgi:hypothetical protein